jgi:hypothetical protein
MTLEIVIVVSTVREMFLSDIPAGEDTSRGE